MLQGLEDFLKMLKFPCPHLISGQTRETDRGKDMVVRIRHKKSVKNSVTNHHTQRTGVKFSVASNLLKVKSAWPYWNFLAICPPVRRWFMVKVPDSGRTLKLILGSRQIQHASVRGAFLGSFVDMFDTLKSWAIDPINVINLVRCALGTSRHHSMDDT